MYDEIINSAAKSHQVEPAIIKAIIKVESNWDTYAVRPEPQIKDASYGLMQVLLGTARTVTGQLITGSMLMEPAINIDVGTRYLKDHLTKYADLKQAISAYNAGHPITGNQTYVDKVFRWYKVYQFVEGAAPFTQYAVPTVLMIGGLVTIFWEGRQKH